MNLPLLKKRMREIGINNKKLIYALDISRSSFYRKTNGITEFTLHEIRIVIDLLELDSYDIEQIFFSE